MKKIQTYNPYFEYYRLINIERSGRKIILITRDSHMQKQIFNVVDFFPFCFIKSDVRVPLKLIRAVKDRVLGDWRHLITGANLDKIYFNKPEDIRMLRDALGQDETAEADVIYTTRFLVEIKVRSGYFILSRPPAKNNTILSYRDIIPIDVRNIPSRNIHFDIEAVDNRTVLNGIWDSYTNRFHSFGWARKTSYSNNDTVLSLNKVGNKTERSLVIPRDTHVFSNIKTPMNLFLDYMNTTKPDVIAGWYIGGYDIPQIFSDCKEFKIDVNKFSPLNSAPAPEKIKGLVQIDLLAGYKKIQSQELRSYRLPNVIKAEFGIDVPSDPKRIPKMWENMPELVDYNTSHVDACRYLDDQKGIIDFVYQLAYVCCCRFDDTESAMRLIDALMLSARDEFVVDPNKPPHEDYGKKNEEEVQGATVLEPIPGVVDEHEIIIDASKLYPTTIISNNLGIEKLDPNGNIKVELKGYDLFIWNNFKPEAVEKFKTYAKEKFDKEWISKATLVKQDNKNPESYTISTSKNEMVLKINKSKTVVKLFINGKLKDKFIIVKEKTNLWVHQPNHVTEVVRFSDTSKCELSKAFGFLFDLRTQYDNELKELMKDEANNRELIELKRQQSFAVKIPTNSIYGLVGNAGFRLYNKKVQECVTQLARDYLQFIIDMSIKYCKKHDIQYKVIYGDTDSIHLKLVGVTLDEAVRIGYAIAKYINKFSYKFAARQGVKPENQSYKVKLEVVSETALYKAKKRYAQKIVWEDGHVLSKPKIDITGLEPKRSDTPEITEKSMMKVIKMALNLKPPEDIKRYANKQYKKVLNGKLSPIEIGVPMGLKQPLETYFRGKCNVKKGGCGNETAGRIPFTSEYDKRPLTCPSCGTKLSYSRPVQAYASAYSNAFLGTKFTAGDKIRYLYIKEVVRNGDSSLMDIGVDEKGKSIIKLSKPIKSEYPDTHVIAIDEETIIPEDFVIDYQKQMETVLQNKIEPLLEIL